MKESIPKPQFQEQPDNDPQANQADQTGGRRRVLRIWQTAWLSSVGKHIQYMQFGEEGLRPLIWLHSVDYPMAPSWGFCVDAAEKGLGVISVRRPGFGETSPAQDTDEEVRLLKAFLKEAALDNAVLIVEGTSRPAGLRLALECEQVSFTLLLRPCYAAVDSDSIDPWLRDMVLQTMQSRAGASLALAALTHVVRRTGVEWLYERFLKDERDREFVRSNARDVTEAWECFAAISADTFRRDMNALEPDPMLTPGLLTGLRGLAVTGAGMPTVWRETFQKTSASLGIETALLPEGGFFAAYNGGPALLEIIAERA